MKNKGKTGHPYFDTGTYTISLVVVVFFRYDIIQNIIVVGGI